MSVRARRARGVEEAERDAPRDVRAENKETTTAIDDAGDV